MFNCYIDESGDEGIDTGGSRWFILGALIVDEENDLQTSTMVSRIKKKFGKDDKWTLHWAEIRKHDQKLYICDELKTHPEALAAKGLRNKWNLYFYSTQLLLERLSWYARDNGNQKAMPIFEHRSSIDYGKMRDYLRLIRDQIPSTNISWSNLEWEHFKIRQKNKSRLLQAADSLVGALGNALEYSGYGYIEPRYILTLNDRFYRRENNLFSYGLKFLHADFQEFNDEYTWLSEI